MATSDSRWDEVPGAVRVIPVREPHPESRPVDVELPVICPRCGQDVAECEHRTRRDADKARTYPY